MDTPTKSKRGRSFTPERARAIALQREARRREARAAVVEAPEPLERLRSDAAPPSTEQSEAGPDGGWSNYRDPTGRRRWITCQSREEAKARLSEVLKIQPQRERASVSVDITVGDYVREQWLPAVQASAKRRTVEVYTGVWARHLEPTLGARKVRTVEAVQIRKLLASSTLAPRASPSAS